MTPTRADQTAEPSSDAPSLRSLRYDLPASLVVFLVALPLSLGIAAASQVPLAAGVIAAVVGGIVAGLFGGSPLTVSGPAAGLVVVVAGLVEQFGFAVTCAITVVAGLVQVLLGVSRVARAVLAISPTVLHAMLAGIGVTIVLGQLHVLLGGAAGSTAWENIRALPDQITDATVGSVLIGLVAVAALITWPRLPKQVRRVPGQLVAIAGVTVLAELAAPSTARVELGGSITDSIQLPTLPAGAWSAVAVGVLTVAIVASVESLLSAVAADSLSQGRTRTRLDRELIGQGLANTTSGLLGGLPITGVIVRTATNISAGARTRSSAILHGVWMAVAALLLVDVIERIPLAALAALLIVVGCQLVKPKDIRESRTHGQFAVYAVTLLGVVFLNLLEGVLLGLALSAVLVVRRAVRADVAVDAPGAEGKPWRVRITGTLSFVSTPRLAKALGAVPQGSPVELALHIDYVDHTAYDYVSQWRERHEASGGTITTREVGPASIGHHDRSSSRSELLPRRWFAPWDEWQSTTGSTDAPFHAGLADYELHFADHLRPAMSHLTDSQHPDALFITCADSRIMPNLITSSGPGDLFTVRNLGNIVPVDGEDVSVRAAIDYAVGILGVSRIVICGHSGCGAMNALRNGVTDGPIGTWLEGGRESLVACDAGHRTARAATEQGGDDLDRLARVNVAVQVDRLRRLPIVADAERDGQVELVGMFFDIASASCTVLDAATGAFRAVVQVPDGVPVSPADAAVEGFPDAGPAVAVNATIRTSNYLSRLP